MKAILQSLCVAFSLYSKIPVPRVEWTRETMRYAVGFMPFIGIAVGALEWGWLWLAQIWKLETVLYGTVAALLPMVVTGGFHLDGFTDTCDALCSYGDRKKRLEILKDPHIGAFGMMYFVALVLLQFGLFCQLRQVPALVSVLAIGFVLARSVGGSLIVWLPCAKDTGLAHLFAENSSRVRVRILLSVQGILCLAGIAAYSLPCAGVLVVGLAVFVPLYRRFCRKTFGGITGDLIGFAITLMETGILAVCTVGGLILRGMA